MVIIWFLESKSSVLAEAILVGVQTASNTDPK